MEPKILIITGIFLIARGAVDLWIKAVIIVLGLLPLFGGVLMALILEPSYAVQISTVSGEVKAFTAFDKSSVNRIVVALNSIIG